MDDKKKAPAKTNEILLREILVKLVKEEVKKQVNDSEPEKMKAIMLANSCMVGRTEEAFLEAPTTEILVYPNGRVKLHDSRTRRTTWTSLANAKWWKPLEEKQALAEA